MTKQLYRVKKESIAGGVAAGLAEYFDIDTTLVRVLFVVAFVVGGAGLLAYLLLWIILPAKESLPEAGAAMPDSAKQPDRRTNVTGGLILVTLGCIFLASEFLPWIHFGKLWPLLLVAAGIGMLWKQSKKNDEEPPAGNTASEGGIN